MKSCVEAPSLLRQNGKISEWMNTKKLEFKFCSFYFLMLNRLIRLASKVSRDKGGGNKAAMLHSSLLAGKKPVADFEPSAKAMSMLNG